MDYLNTDEVEMEHKNERTIVVAGASGYLGRHIVAASKDRGYYVRALLRRTPEAGMFARQPDELVIAEATDPKALGKLCRPGDTVISSLGITWQRDGFTYEQVDFGANANILRQAERAEASRFAYVSVLNGEKLRNTRLVDAKERFVDRLNASPLPATIIRPSGFFSDMADFYAMASKGTVYLFGDGSVKTNPIDGGDLAEEILNAYERGYLELNIGGPVTYTLAQIAELALEKQKKKTKKTARIRYIPDLFRKLTLAILPRITPVSIHGPIQFFLTALAMDQSTSQYGHKRLEEFFDTLI